MLILTYSNASHEKSCSINNVPSFISRNLKAAAEILTHFDYIDGKHTSLFESSVNHPDNYHNLNYLHILSKEEVTKSTQLLH